MASTPASIRLRMDAILALAAFKESFRKQLVKSPLKVLPQFGFTAKEAKHTAEKFGIGPFADCGGDTCRLTSACGWTVCGKTTNGCIQVPNIGGVLINPNPVGK